MTTMIYGLVGIAVALLVAVTVQLLRQRSGTGLLSLYCPWVRRSVAVRVATADGRVPVHVLSCSAFSDPGAVACRGQCVAGEDGQATLEADRPRRVTAG